MCRKSLILEEWKLARHTIMEFDHILSKIRYLDVTITAVLFAGGFEYSKDLFFIAMVLNIAFIVLELYYHRFLNTTAEYAIKLEKKLYFKITTNLQTTKYGYRNRKPQLSIYCDIFPMSVKYLGGCFISHIYYWIYIALILLSMFLLFKVPSENSFILPYIRSFI
jgi:uncharacterized membrane protein